MALPIYSLSVACERSIVDYLTANLTGSITGVNFYTGQNNETKEAPAVIVIAQQGEEIYKGTRNYRMAVDIQVKEMAQDTVKNDIGVLAMHIFDMFENAPSVFTNVDYSFYSIDTQIAGVSTSTEEDALVNQLTVDFICCL